MTRKEIFQAIEKERARQDELHPVELTPLARLAVLMEEVGEVAEALQEGPAPGTLEHLEEELIQVAATAVRWLENK
jgi:NTP pyrophosphatase (non-canonical NTP hydrolase)